MNGALASEAPASERFAARLDAAYQTNGSFIDFVEGERFFAAPSFRWNLGPETALTLRGEYANDDRSTTLDFPVVGGRVLEAPYERYFGEPGFTEIEANTWRGLATLDRRWNEDHATSVSLHGVRSESEVGNFILFNFAGPLQDPATGDITRAAEIIDFTGDYSPPASTTPGTRRSTRDHRRCQRTARLAKRRAGSFRQCRVSFSCRWSSTAKRSTATAY